MASSKSAIALEIVLLAMDNAAIDPGTDFLVVDAQGRRQIGDRTLVVVFPRIEDDSTIDQWIGLFWRQADRVAVVDDGAVGFADALIDRAALDVEEGVCR